MNNQAFKGCYYITHECGLLAADFFGSSPELRLETPWQNFRLYPDERCPGQQLSLSLGTNTKVEQLQDELGVLFGRVVTLLDRFFENRHELLIFCVSGGKRAVELVEQLPALGFVCAQSLSPIPYLCATKIESWVGDKRVSLLQRFGFPAKQWVVRLFQKIPVSECSCVLFNDLKSLLNQPEAATTKMLQHLKSINLPVLKTLLDPQFARHFHPYCLHEISREPSDSERIELLWEIHEISPVFIEAINRGLKIPLIRFLEDLRDIHEMVVVWLNENHFWSARSYVDYSVPPVPALNPESDANADSSITPITNNKALWLEGRKMHHCIAAYDSQIVEQKGNIYAYHVEVPGERSASLMIERTASGWEVQQIEGPANEEVSAKTINVVLQWLKKHNQKMGMYLGV